MPGRKYTLPPIPRVGSPMRASTMAGVIKVLEGLTQDSTPTLGTRPPRPRATGAASGRAEFRVFRGVLQNQLNMEPGSIVRLLRRGNLTRIELPVFPTIDGVPCNELQGEGGKDGYPFVDLTDRLVETTYQLCLVATDTTAKIELGQSGDANIAPGPGRIVRLIAEVTLEADDNENLTLLDIDQRWIGSMELRFDVPPPFDLQLLVDDSGEEPAYKVTIAPGIVQERVPGNVPALIEYQANNIGLIGAPRAEFAIVVGQQISLVVNVRAVGTIGADGGDAVTAVIEGENPDSVHYIPPCADDAEGVPGAYHYKLGVLRASPVEGEPPYLEQWLAGSHIDHFQDVTRLDNTSNAVSADSARVVKKYDADTNRYLIRFLTKHPDSQMQIVEQPDAMQVRGSAIDGSLIFTDCEDNEVARLEWLDGYIMTPGVQTIKAGCYTSPNNQ